jgi:hypothetical protein
MSLFQPRTGNTLSPDLPTTFSVYPHPSTYLKPSWIIMCKVKEQVFRLVVGFHSQEELNNCCLQFLTLHKEPLQKMGSSMSIRTRSAFDGNSVK